MHLNCGPCQLRPWRADDADALIRHADNPRVAEYLRDRFPSPYTAADADAWLGFVSVQRSPARLRHRYRGRAGRRHRPGAEHRHRAVSAEIGYWVAEPYWGRGLATAALRGLAPWAMARFELTRLYATTFAHHAASRCAPRKSRVVLEAVLRRAAIKRGWSTTSPSTATPRRPGHDSPLLVAAWGFALTAAVLGPEWSPPRRPRRRPRPADGPRRRGVLLPRGGAMLWPARDARLAWTLGLLAYLVHVALAFHHAFGWSHAAAVAQTQERSGFGEGIYASHLFTLLWVVDVCWWWLSPAGAGRPAWVGYVLHGYMAFVVFNATVVYETGFIRWARAAGSRPSPRAGLASGERPSGVDRFREPGAAAPQERVPAVEGRDAVLAFREGRRQRRLVGRRRRQLHHAQERAVVVVEGDGAAGGVDPESG